MRKQIYKSTGNKSLFDEQFAVEKLIKIGNPLEKISAVIDFEIFRNTLENKILKFRSKLSGIFIRTF